MVSATRYIRKAKLVPLNTLIWKSQADWLDRLAVDDGLAKASVVRAALQLYREQLEDK